MNALSGSKIESSPRSPIWVALRLPFIALEAWGIAANEDVHVLVSAKNRVVNASKKSLMEVSLGAPTSTAQMMLNARVIQNDEQKTQALLAELTQVIYQFTPHYQYYNQGQHYNQDAILLEISSCVNLFKSPQILLDKLLAALQQCYQAYCAKHAEDASLSKQVTINPLTIDIGIAHTRLGAWLLSFKHLPIVFDDLPQRSLTALVTCELDLLAEYLAIVDRLKKTGFVTLGDLFLQNAFELRDRYGSPFIDYVSDILGVDLAYSPQQAEASFLPTKSSNQRPTEIIEQAFIERCDLDNPASSLAELEAIFKALLLRLQQYLLKQQKQCDKIRWRLYNIYHDESTHTLRIPGLHSQWEFALELTRLHFDNIELPFEVDAVVLDCVNIAPLECATPSLFGSGGDSQDEQKLLTKLSARLGKNAVFTLRYVDSHIPECTTQKVAAGAKPTKTTGTDGLAITNDRPTWLLREPQRLRCSPQGLFYKGKLRLLSGPERIQQLWSDKTVWRDYFIAIQEDASRLWVFKDLRDQQWYLHGVF